MKKIISQNYWKLGAVFTSTVLFPLQCSAHTLSGGTVSIDWPWTKFLNSLVEQMTGPVPKALGTLAIVAAAGMGLSGSNFSNKMIGLIFAIGIALFAPTFINAISSSGTGMLAF